MNPFITRALTALVLGIMVLSGLLFVSPTYLSIVIACLYGYACIGEFIPLALQSRQTALLTTIFAGIALIITGIVHTYWAYTSNYLPLGLCITLAALSDTGGYIIGNICGTHLLVPSISPKKTWEGLAGSVAFASFFLCAVVTRLCIVHNYSTDHRVLLYLLLMGLFGALFAIAGTLGDLLFSYIKRAAQVKDTGTILPGHGGILDRIDSIVGVTIALAVLTLNGINLFISLLYQQ